MRLPEPWNGVGARRWTHFLSTFDTDRPSGRFRGMAVRPMDFIIRPSGIGTGIGAVTRIGVGIGAEIGTGTSIRIEAKTGTGTCSGESPHPANKKRRPASEPPAHHQNPARTA